MYNHILVPTDGSAGARPAVVHGTAIARRFDATLHALSVLSEGPYGSLESDESRTESERAAERAVERVAVEAKREGVDVVTELRRGVPHEEILSYVADNDVDMIVMGTHARTGLDRVLVGSVTEQVVRTADVPVVTVRTSDEVEIATDEEAVDLAREALAERGHEDASVSADPHRTSGSWIVPAETGDGTVHVHVDAATGDARLARIDD